MPCRLTLSEPGETGWIPYFFFYYVQLCGFEAGPPAVEGVVGGWEALPRYAGDQDGWVIHALKTGLAPWPCSRDEIVKTSERKVPEHTPSTAPPAWHQFSD